MVNVDTVYQRVLALANKEQRGYITPQEFNLYAVKAQGEIVENYLHDYKTLDVKPKTNLNFADERDLLDSRVQHVSGEILNQTLTENTNALTYSDVKPLAIKSVTNNATGKTLSRLTSSEFSLANEHPLTKPTKDRMVWVNDSISGNNTIDIYPALSEATSFNIKYIKNPYIVKCNWGYVVVKDKALYNSSTTNHFMLHPLEENNLISRILQLSGISIQRVDLIQAVMAEKQQELQDNNN